MKKAIISLFVVLLAVSAQAQMPSVADIAKRAEDRFGAFMNDGKNVKFSVAENENVNKFVYKMGNKIRIEYCPPIIGNKLAKPKILGIWFYDDASKEKYYVVPENQMQYNNVTNKKDLGGAFFGIFRDWWNLDLSSAIMEKSEKIGDKDCYVINFDRFNQITEYYRIWVDKQTYNLVKEETKSTREQIKNQERRYTDYKKISEGFEMTFAVEFWYAGKLSNKLKIKISTDRVNYTELFNEFNAYISSIEQAKIAAPKKEYSQKELQRQSKEIHTIFDEAKKRFESFANDEKSMVFAVNAPEYSYTVYKKGKKVRIEQKYLSPLKQEMNRAVVYTRDTDFVYEKGDGKVVKIPYVRYVKIPNLLFDKVFRNWWEFDIMAAKVTGSETVDGKDCHVIEFGYLHVMQKSYKIWVDKKTFNLVKEERSDKYFPKFGEKPDEEKKKIFEKLKISKFSDYRVIAGNWEKPFLVETYIDGKLVSSEKIGDIQKDAVLADEIFVEEVTNFNKPKILPGNQTNIASTLPPAAVPPPSAAAPAATPKPSVFNKEENIVLKFTVNTDVTTATSRRSADQYVLTPTGITMSIVNTNNDQYRDLVPDGCKVNENDFFIKFNGPVYVSKIAFKSEGKPVSSDLPINVYYNLGVNISYLDKDGQNKTLPIFNPIGKSYFDIVIKDFVTQIKVTNARPEIKLESKMNLFYCIFYGIAKIEFSCIAGKKPEDKIVKPDAVVAEKKKEDEKSVEVLKTAPADAKMTKEILPGLCEKAKSSNILKDRKNNIDMEYIGSLVTEENKKKSYTRLDGKIYKGGDNIKWDIFSTPEGLATSYLWFIYNYTADKTASFSMSGLKFNNPDLLLNWWEEPGLEIIKIEKHEERECYLVRGQAGVNKYSLFWLDRENNRLLRVKRELLRGEDQPVKEEINYTYKKVKKQGFELPYFIKKTSKDNAKTTVLKILIHSKYLTEVSDAIFDEKNSAWKTYDLRGGAINKRNKIEEEREAELEKYKEDIKNFTAKRSFSRRFTDAITGFSFIAPEDFSRSPYYYNVFKYKPVKKKQAAEKDKEIIDGDGTISIHKSYTSENIERLVASYKESFLKKHPGAKFEDKTKMKIRDTDAAVVKVEYENEDGETVKSRDLLLKIKNTLVNVSFDYELLSEEDADKYQKSILSAVSIGDSTRVAHSFFSPKLEEVYRLKEEKKFAEMEKVIDAELAKYTADAEMLFLKATLLAKKGDNEGAVAALKMSYESGNCDFSAIFKEKDFEKLVASKRLDLILNDKEKLYVTGRKNLLVAVRRELASYYEVKLKSDNILIFTDEKEKEYIEQIKTFTEVFGNYAKANLGVQNTPFSVIWVFSEKGDVNSAMIGMLTGSDGYFSGLFVPSHGILLTDVYSGIGVFGHEYTHALHAGSQNANNQAHPLWLTEMLSTINEEFDYDGGKKTITMNMKGDRYESVLDGIANDRMISIEKLITMTDKELMDSKNIEMFYAEVRYLGLYIQQKSTISRFYEQYKGDFKTDKTGKTSIETILNTEISALQKDWENWIISINQK